MSDELAGFLRSAVLALVKIAALLFGAGIVVLMAFATRELAAIWQADAERVNPVGQQLAQHTTEISSISADVGRLTAEIRALSEAPDRTTVGQQVARLDTIATDLQRRQQRIEAAIMADPVKALQLPLLHRDIETLRAAQLQQVDGLRKEIDRLYDVTKWVIGGLAGAVVLLVVSFGRGAFRFRRKEAET